MLHATEPYCSPGRPSADLPRLALHRGGASAVAERQFVATLTGREAPGIAARVTSALTHAGDRIERADYHSDPGNRRFFARVVVSADHDTSTLARLRGRVAQLGRQLGSDTSWKVRDTSYPQRAVILVSGELHCLHDLLHKTKLGELPMTVSAVVGNHIAAAEMVEQHGIPFHLVPFPGRDSRDVHRDAPRDAAGQRREAFKRIAQIVDEHDPAVIILARFMQVLPEYLCSNWDGRSINIHHSVLPSFAGARPYHQAHARGVKLVGATCHYVTRDLDAGPIIEQDVIRVRLGDTVQDLIRRGRNVERVVLARGVQWHLEDRVFVNGDRTVVLK